MLFLSTRTRTRCSLPPDVPIRRNSLRSIFAQMAPKVRARQPLCRQCLADGVDAPSKSRSGLCWRHYNLSRRQFTAALRLAELMREEPTPPSSAERLGLKRKAPGDSSECIHAMYGLDAPPPSSRPRHSEPSRRPLTMQLSAETVRSESVAQSPAKEQELVQQAGLVVVVLSSAFVVEWCFVLSKMPE